MFTPVLSLARIALCAALISQGVHADLPPRPLYDPWYSAPDGWEKTKPGDILRSRNTTDWCSSLGDNCGQVWQYVYRTTNSQYQPSWAVTSLLIPIKKSKKPTTKLVQYGAFEDSVNLNQAPSGDIYGSGGGGENEEPQWALNRGWYVNMADYEGPNSSFTAGVQSGHATLDAIRAVLKHKNNPIKLPKDIRYALWGFSGGALASEWAAELQPQYAPELCIEGTALGGLTPNISSVLYKINGGFWAGLAPAGILGLASQWPDAMAAVVADLKNSSEDSTYNADKFYEVRQYGLDLELYYYNNQDISKYFRHGFDIFKSGPVYDAIQKDGIMGNHATPPHPLFIYKGVNDDISDVADTDALVAKYCKDGATIEYNRNINAYHSDEFQKGDAPAVEFLKAIFAGTYAGKGCNITTAAWTGDFDYGK